jgi:hypothetical protein
MLGESREKFENHEPQASDFQTFSSVSWVQIQSLKKRNQQPFIDGGISLILTRDDGYG